MRKIAVIVPESTAEKIEVKAREQGTSLGAVCCESLIATFDPGAKIKLDKRNKLMEQVENEVSEFLNKLEIGDRFSIVEASETFRDFYKTHSPSEALTLKKQIGCRLKRKVGVRGTVFEYVSMATDEDDKPIKDSRSHAIQYEVVSVKGSEPSKSVN